MKRTESIPLDLQEFKSTPNGIAPKQVALVCATFSTSVLPPNQINSLGYFPPDSSHVPVRLVIADKGTVRRPPTVWGMDNQNQRYQPEVLAQHYGLHDH
jgi:hypothetical protein